MYTFTVFSIDTLFKEPFEYTQIFNFNEFTFFTTRGIMTTVALAFSVVSTCSILLILVTEHNLARDHSFTLAFLHFCVVSLVTLDFPTSYPWWISLVVGGVALDGICEFAIYQINTMPYKSHMAGDQKRKKVKKAVTSTPRVGAQKKTEGRQGLSMEATEEQEVEKIPQRKSSPNAVVDAPLFPSDTLGTIILPQIISSWTETPLPLVEMDDMLAAPAPSPKKSPSRPAHQRSLSTSHTSPTGGDVALNISPFGSTQDLFVDVPVSQLLPRRSLSLISTGEVGIEDVNFTVSPRVKQQQRPPDEFF
jgi:hypothetical protein